MLSQSLSVLATYYSSLGYNHFLQSDCTFGFSTLRLNPRYWPKNNEKGISRTWAGQAPWKLSDEALSRYCASGEVPRISWWISNLIFVGFSPVSFISWRTSLLYSSDYPEISFHYLENYLVRWNLCFLDPILLFVGLFLLFGDTHKLVASWKTSRISIHLPCMSSSVFISVLTVD